MALGFRMTEPTATASMLIDAERQLGFDLPAEYRELLRTVGNGGAVRTCVLPDSDQLALQGILGVGRNDGFDLAVRVREYAGQLPVGLLPIADAEGGNLVCCSMRAAYVGTIWYWDHELEDSSSVVRVADGLGDFLDRLVEPTVATENIGGGARVVWANPAFVAVQRALGNTIDEQ